MGSRSQYVVRCCNFYDIDLAWINYSKHLHYVVYSIQQFCVDIINKSNCLLDYSFFLLDGGGGEEDWNDWS